MKNVHSKTFGFALAQVLLFIVLNFSFSPKAFGQNTAPSADFDGDGIINSIDLDDDNDGIPDLLECPRVNPPNSCSAPSFGLVQDIGNTGCLTVESPSPDLMTVNGGYVPSNTPVSPDGGAFLSAVYHQSAAIDEFSSLTINQLTIGASYRIEFWQAAVGQANGNAWYKNGFWQIVDKANNTVLGETNVSTGPGVSLNGSTTIWTREGVTFTATATSMTLLIKPRSSPLNDPVGVRMALDAISTLSLNDAFCDTDNDGLPNQFDLDSDGDGCPDAKESGVAALLSSGSVKNGNNTGAVTTTITTADAVVSGTVGANGLLNSLETTAESGQINYTSYYDSYAKLANVNICTTIDTDLDGVLDTADLDDDNDGIPDTDEYCKSSILLPATNTTATITEFRVPTGWTITNSSPDIATTASSIYNGWVGGCAGTAPAAPNGHTSWVNFYSNTQEAFKTTITGLTVGKTYILKAFYAKFAATPALGRITVKLGTTVIDQYTPTLGCGWETRFITFTATATSHDLQFQNTGIASPMQNASISISADPIYEVCDSDNDGIPNHLDLDSDGDGCTDAKEAGVSGTLRNGEVKNGANGGVVTTTTNMAGAIAGAVSSYGANGLADAVETSAESGIINYPSTYANYALSNSLNICSGVDSDGDGVTDLTDLDDDNDGVKDCEEGVIIPLNFSSPTLFTNRNIDAAGIVKYSSSQIGTGGQLNGPSGDANGNISVSVNSGVGLRTSYSVAFSYPTSIIIRNNTKIIQGYLTFDEYFDFSTSVGNIIALSDPAFELQIFLNNAWVDVPANYSAATIRWRVKEGSFQPGAGNFAFTIQNASSFTFYHFNNQNTSANATTLNISRNCIDTDTDNDGIPNRLDLDSDGDSCPDALESGVSGSLTTGTIKNGLNGNVTSTTNSVANAIAVGTYGTNGLADGVESTPESGFVNYASKYGQFALSPTLANCKDSDGDGIVDLLDIDDDNDGVLDATESPSCFMSIDDWNTTNKSMYATITSDLTTLAGYTNFAELADNEGALSGTKFVTATAQAQLSKAIFKVEFSSPTQLDALYIQKYDATQIFAATAASLKLQGSNDNNSWTDLTAALGQPANASYTTANGARAITNANKFIVTTGAGKYKYYRIYGILAANVLSGTANEFFFDINNASYQASNFTLATCKNDTDGDGIVNHLDLDSDGDGCSDALESSATTSTTANFTFSGTMGANGLDNSLETIVDNGNIIYTSTYNAYAKEILINACLDSDGDGVRNVLDIDDDNDGVLDVTEQYCATNGALTDLYGPTYWKSISWTGGAYLAQYSTTTPDIYIDGVLNNGVEVFRPGTVDNPIAGDDFTATPIIYTLVPQNPFHADGFSIVNDFGALGDNIVKADIKLYTGSVSSPTLMGTETIDNMLDVTSTTRYAFSKGYDNITSIKIYVYKTQPAGTQAANGMQMGELGLYSNAGTYCADLDTDGDGILNRLDLDSDGDGCSDAIETGATTNTTSNYLFTGTMGTNGLDNSLETVVDNGIINYVSTYSYSVANNYAACADLDQDGINDVIDIDDDNDGILDAIESPNCFFTSTEWNTADKFFFAQISSQLNTLSANTNFAGLTDGIGGNIAALQFSTSPAQAQLDKEIFKITLSHPTRLDAIYIKKTSATQIFAATTASLKVQGSINNTTWTDLTAAIASPSDATNTTANGAVSLTNSNKFTLTTNLGEYKYYRIYGVVAANILSGVASEFYFDVPNSSYQASYYNKPNCTDDADADGLLNHQDLDSDGDGCPDAREAGVSGTLNAGTISNKVNNVLTTTANVVGTIANGAYGLNGFADALETSSESGIYSGTYNYNYASSAAVSLCMDSDNDGVVDINDLDDDNDGVLDDTECPPFDINNLSYSPTAFTVTNGASASQTFPAAPDGLVVNVWTLDNSFNVRINGTHLTNPEELQFWTGSPSDALFEFLDGTTYSAVWGIVGNQAKPLIRIYIDKVGRLKVYGSRTSGGALEEMRLRNGTFNRITLNTNASNTFQIGQAVVAQTFISGDYGVITPPSCDDDNDGIANGLDLDSDGDGCPDAKEAGVNGTLLSGDVKNGANGAVTSTTNLPNAIAGSAGNYGANGLANVVETSSESGVISYTSTYTNFARSSTLNVCLDTDNDGVADVLDIDDDNDGILDSTEQIVCLGTGVNLSSLTFSGTAVTSKTANTITSSNTNAWISSYSTENYELPISFKFKRPTVGNTAMLGLLPVYGTQTPTTYATNSYKFYFTSTTVQVPFGTSYNVSQTASAEDEYSVDISSTGYITMKINGIQKAAFQGVNSSYKLAVSGLTTTVFTDIRLSNPSNPLVTTCTDTDNDGIPNYLDLDSDGDGCPDAKEASITGTLNSGSVKNGSNGAVTSTTSVANSIAAGNYGTNGFADALETSGESGIYAGVYTTENVLSAFLNACSDTDSDGVADLVDIDDDNDGILDAVESPSCFYTSEELALPIAVSTELAPYSTYVIGNSIDGNSATSSAFAPSVSWVNKEIFKLKALKPIPISGLSLDLSTWALSNVAGNTFKLQGSIDNTTWTDLSSAVSSTTTSGIFTLTNSIAPDTKYLHYRVIGVAGTSYYGGVSEIKFVISPSFNGSQYTKPACTSGTSDGDTTPNHLDLDSDGDGCSDAYEAGTTSSVTANFVHTTAMGANGFADALETAENGQYTGIYTYYYANNTGFKICLDTDTDGIKDIVDVDDDNDGILDATESPTCFYTALEASIPVTVTSELEIYNNNIPSRVLDNNVSTFSAFMPSNNWVNKDIFRITPNVVGPIAISGVKMDLVSWAISNGTGNTFKLQGSLDNGATWVDLSAAVSSTLTTGSFTVSNTLNPTVKYSLFRITGAVGVSYYGGVTELSLVLPSSYQASMYPKGLCTNDTDNDGKLNHVDLDSDGDGCNDAKEVGTATNTTSAQGVLASPYGVNGFADALETVVDNGVYNGSYVYKYALSSADNGCLDTDNDGLGNLLDLDDDNDGVLDTVEENCSIVTTSKTGIIITKPATINYSYNSNNITNLIDGVDNNVYVAHSPTGTLNNSPWLNFEFPTPKALTYLEIGHYVNQYLFSLSSTYKIQGSTDNTNWTDVTGTFTYNNVATATSGGLSSNNSNIANFASNRTAYKYYRIYGLSGAAGAGWATEIYFKEAYCLTDIDNDGIPNALDLDSDGDGCSDAKEAGSSTTATSTSAYPTGSDTNGNGLLNNYEDATAGTVNYTSTYSSYALDANINVCVDSDNDGVIDITDVDDDNDGVLDVTEYNCEVSTMSKTGITVSSTVTWGYNSTTLNNLVDGAESIVVYPNGEFLNETIFQFNLPSAKVLEQIEISTQSGLTTLGTTGTYNLEGWNGSGWVVIEKNKTFGGTSAPIRAPGNTYKFYMPNNLTAYTKYRIFGTSIKGTYNSSSWVQEAYFFERSCNTDVDNDGIKNWLDSDSDGDNCPDAVEAGTTSIGTSGVASNARLSASTIPAPYSSNGFATGLETTAGNGVYSGTYTYTMAVDATINACTDTDSDGITNAIDLDDDNDGVLDVTELNCATSIVAKTGITVSSTVTWGYSSSTLANLVNGKEDLTAYSTSDFIDQTILQFDFTSAKALSLIEISTQNSGTTLGTTGKYNVQGWNGTKWINILTNQTFAMTAPVLAPANSYTIKMPSNTTAYTKYRILGTSTKGTISTTTWIQEAYFTEQSCNLDADNDGIPNAQDPDSDGDGCSDTIEAGVVGLTTSYGANGFSNALETAESGVYNGTYSYQFATDATFSSCRDTDNDGVTDVNDIDDDNDGILDSVECPSTQMITNGDFSNGTTGWTLGSGWTLESGKMANYVDGVTNSVLSQTIGRPYPTTRPGYVDFNVDVRASGFNNVQSNAYTASLIMQVNGVQYAVLTNPSSSTTATIQTFNGAISSIATFPVQLLSGPLTTVTISIPSSVFFASNQVGIGFTAGNDDFVIDNVSLTTSPSLAACDTDGDGIPNSRDLDSDGDGCFDAAEAKTVTSLTQSTIVAPFGNNGFANSIETSSESGIYSGTYLYSRATDASIKGCTDTDFDSVPDIDDVDDDNDGILDTNECISALSQTFPTTGGNTNTLTGWTVGGTYASSGSWTSSTGRINLNSNGLEFRRDASTTSTITRSITNLPANSEITLGNLYWFNTNAADNTVVATLHVKLNGVTYATIKTGTANTAQPTITVANGASTNLNLLPSTAVNTASSKSNLVLKLPNATIASASLVFEFIASTSAGEVDDIGFASIAINSCAADTDGDGIPNQLDLDSDGDGCSDANEAYNSSTAQGTDGNSYYGTGTPPAVDATGKVTGASYTASSTNVLSAGTASIITVQPVDLTATPAATNLSYSATVTAGSGTTSYQWQVSTNGGGTWTNITNNATYSGATTATLTLSSVTILMKEYRYRLNIAQSDFICGNLTSSAARLIMSNTPTVTDDVATATEDTSLNGSVLTNDSGSGSSAITVTNFTINGTTYTAGQTATIANVGTIVIRADGTYTFSPAANYNGAVPVISYTATDANGGSDAGDLTISITPVNDPVVVVNETISTNQGTIATGSILTNDTDADGDTLSVLQFTVGGVSYNVGTSVSIPGKGTITVAADGTYTFTPIATYSGSVPVIGYTVSDGNGSSVNGTLSITVIDVNDPPVAADDITTTLQNTPVSGNVLTNDSDPESNTLSITKITIAGVDYPAGTSATIANVGTVVVNTDGSYTFTPTSTFTGAAPVITYTVSDGTATSTADLKIAVTAVVNANPVAAADTKTTTEDTPATGNVLTNDTDAEGNTLSLTSFTINGVTYPAGTSANIAGVGTVVVNADGTYTFTPLANYAGTVPVIGYAISDGNGGTANGTLTVSITPVNDAPLATNDAASVTEDTPKTGNVSANDSDVEGNTLSITQFVINGTTYPAGQTATLAGVGTLVINADGSYTFTPEPNYSGSVPVATYTLSDGNGGTDTADLTLTMVAVNDAPVASDDAATTPQGSVKTGDIVTGADTDDDGNTLTLTQFKINGVTYPTGTTANIPGVGTLQINADGTYTFTPLPAYVGTVPTVEYTISDGNGGTDTGNFVMTVTDVNDPPIAALDEKTVNQNSAATGVLLGNDTDADNNALSITQFVINGVTTIVDPTNGGTYTLTGVGTFIVAANGNYTFTPLSSYVGTTPALTYTVSDGTATTTSTLTVYVEPVDFPPVAVADTKTINEDGVASDNVLSNDTDANNDVLAVTQFTVGGQTYPAGTTATIPNVGTLVVNADGNYTFTPLANYNGTVPAISYLVTDGAGATATGQLAITVTAVNDAPVALDDQATTPEDTVLSGNVKSNDSDVDGNTTTVSQFTVGGQTYSPGQTANIANVGSLQLNADGSYTFTPAANYNGAFSAVTYTINDGNGGTATANLAINITAVNDAPVASNDTDTTPQGTAKSGDILTGADTDVDGNSLTLTQFTIGGVTYPAGTTASIPGVGTLVINADGTYTFTPIATYVGAVPTVTYTLSDGNGGTSNGTFILTVTDVPEPPVATDDIKSAGKNTVVTGNLVGNDSDPESNTLTIASYSINGVTGPFTLGSTITIPNVGTMRVNSDGSYVFTPLPIYSGSVPVLTYTVSDGNGGTDTGALSITVIDTNTPPIATNDPVAATEDTPRSGNVLSNDSDPNGDALTVVSFVVGSTTYPAGATATIPNVGTITLAANGAFTFTPFTNYNGTVPAINYTITDGLGGVATAALNITVAAVNDDPIAVNDDNISGPEDSPITGNVLANDSDPDGTPITVSQFSVGGTTYPAGTTATISGKGSLVINADGSFTFTPLANYFGPVPTITYTALDVNGATATATLGLTVSPVNDPPVVVNDAITVPEGTTGTGNVLTNDADLESGTLAVTQFTINGTIYTPGSIVSLPNVGTIVLNADGTYSFTGVPNYSGAVPVISYTATDGTGGLSTGTLTVSIQNVNDAPVVVSETVITPEDTPATGNVLTNDTDPEATALSITQFLVGGVSYNAGQTASISGVGTITISSSGAYLFTPVANYFGNVPPVIYTVSDGQATTPGSLTISVTSVNDAPVAVNDTKVGEVNANVAGNVLTNDTDVENGTLSVVDFVINGTTYPAGQTSTIPNVGTVTINADGTFTFVPALNYAGTLPVITYNINDGTGGTASATLALSVTFDTDGDGIPDSVEKGPGIAPDTDGDGIPDYKDLDSDNDGILDNVENTACVPAVMPCDIDGDGIPNYLDLDSDGDGISDVIEAGGTDGNADGKVDGAVDAQGIPVAANGGLTPPNTDGTGGTNPYDTDSDGDGISDLIEGTRDTDGDGTPDYKDLDSDGDGISDAIEGSADTDGDGIPNFRDLDSDGDGITDAIEGIADTDNDGRPNFLDTDSDGDTIPDSVEGSADTDNDGTPDYKDLDSDGDGIPDSVEGTTDTDGDGTPNYKDTDSDGDGIPDSTEKGINPLSPRDTDGDGTPDYKDLDSDGDGIPDSVEGTTDTDGDGLPNYMDPDSDGDGIPDSVEKGINPLVPLDTDGDGIPDYLDTDSDNDGITDAVEKGPNPAQPLDTDGDGIPDYRDLDSDNDGISDAVEGTTDTDGDGTPNYRDLDSDADGKPDQQEGVGDPDSDTITNYLDPDSDNDGVLDSVDQCPLVAGNLASGCPLDSDNDGVPDSTDFDDDNDGILDGVEDAACSPTAATCDTDSDGIPNNLDPDSDNDGITDVRESNGTDVDGDGIVDGAVDANGVPTSANGGVTPPNTDGTGGSNPYDSDSDGDGIPDSIEKGPNGNAPLDSDGDNIPNYLDTDSDGDGIPDSIERGSGTAIADTDGDGTPDYLDLDSDGDSITDAIEKGPNGATPLDTDNDGIPNFRDVDSDGDGIPDSIEGTTDTDTDGTPNYLDTDSDGDGISDSIEKGPNPLSPIDTDNDGTPDYKDLDSDGDGITDAIEGAMDTDSDGIPNYRDTDSDGDGIFDATEGTTDTDNDGIPNYKDLDSDGDGISDTTEGTLDSDGDGTPDYKDLDSDGDGISDAMEGTRDTDGDGTPDYLDLDSDGDGISDSTEGTLDTDGDGTPNYRDVDSDGDGIPDAIEGTIDSDGDSRPDYLDTDSDGDGVPDSTEGNVDTDGDSMPDYLDLDSDGDGVLDATDLCRVTVGDVSNNGCPTDFDGDGIIDSLDYDDDNDGILDTIENAACNPTSANCDTDADGIPNRFDLDSDGDGIKDVREANGIDVNADGIVDGGVDANGVPNAANGGLTPPNTDGTGGLNPYDTDSDGDGIPDSAEKGTNGNVPRDTDGDGTADYLDLDSDGDGILDAVEGNVDTDGDGIPNYRDLDSDGDGVIDATEVVDGTSPTNACSLTPAHQTVCTRLVRR
jgi:CshA-type fibril repeat protein